MTDPITEAKRLTPWWMMEIRRFDGLELHPVRDNLWDEDERGPRPFDNPDDHETCCEPCEANEAHFWSVYAHLVEGGIECLEDFPTEAAARRFAEQLLAAYPHLRRHGLMG
ncbi:MAG: hypothetical protein AAFY02_20935 [Pseudomonadota bacterium]